MLIALQPLWLDLSMTGFRKQAMKDQLPCTAMQAAQSKQPIKITNNAVCR
jgi:hypothetical protein